MRPHFRVDDIVVDVCGLHFAEKSQLRVIRGPHKLSSTSNLFWRSFCYRMGGVVSRDTSLGDAFGVVRDASSVSLLMDIHGIEVLASLSS